MNATVKKMLLFSLMALLVAALWFRVCYGGLIPDEAYTWAQCQRFLLGDLPFRHEWSAHQITSFVFTPLYYMFLRFGMTHDGIILYTRRVFVIIWVVYLGFIYFRWRRIHCLGAMLGMMAIAFIPPRYVYSLSYNSIAFMGMLSSITFYMTAKKHFALNYMLSGFCYAFAVIGIPHVAIMFIPFAIYAALRDRKLLIYFSMGGALVATALLIALLRCVSFVEIIQAIPHILDNPEHARVGLFAYVRAVAGAFLKILSFVGFGIVYWAVFLIAFFDKKSCKRWLVYWCVSIVLFMLCAIYYGLFQDGNTLNTLICHLALFSGLMLIVWKGAAEKKLLYACLVPAVLFAFVYSIASNTGPRAAASGFGIFVVPGIVGIMQFKDRYFPMLPERGKKIFTIGLCALLGMHYILAFVVAPAKEWSSQLTEYKVGPLAGIYYYPDLEVASNNLVADINSLPSGCKNVFIVERYMVWPYLVRDIGVAIPWSWCNSFDGHLVDVLHQYWKMNPHKMPDAIIVTERWSSDFHEIRDGLFDSSEYLEQMLPSGNLLLRKR